MSKGLVISEVFGEELAACGVRFRKSAKTLLRRVREGEVGSELVTYVKADGGVRVEARAVLERGAVVARNGGDFGGGVFNEWTIGEEGVKKNYGVEVFEGLGEEFVGYRKVGEVVAIELTRGRFERCEQMGSVEGEDVLIAVSWSKEPMRARVGDWLTSVGYSISGVDMGAYERI